MIVRIGVDVVVRAPHRASAANEHGDLLRSGYRFRTSPTDHEQLWSRLPEGVPAEDMTVVMEPTCNAWVPLAAWFRRRGAYVVFVPAERSADLRAYYANHTKSDRLDSVLLAGLPLLHSEGLHSERGLGPGDPLRRATKMHSMLVKCHTTSIAGLDALLDILAPDWHAAFNGDLSNLTPLRFVATCYGDPIAGRRLGRTRLVRFLHRHPRGSWGEVMADMILTAAAASRKLWGEDMEFTDLGEDIAIEARLALRITDELTELDHRIDALARERDRNGSITSAPGVGAVSGAIILGRLGDPGRFRSLAAVRSFSGLVPSLDSSGISSQHGGPTMHGDALLREALFISADQACRQDPTLAVKYHRLMVVYGKHHNTAIPHIAATLLTRIAACWNANTPYELRDVDGTAVTLDQGRAIIQARYTVPESLRRSRTTTRRSRRSKESPSAPSTGPSRPQATQRPVA